MIQSCHLRYRYFTEKNIDRISTYKNKRCILGHYHPSCNAFFIVFIAPPRDLTRHNSDAIVKIPNFVKQLKSIFCQISTMAKIRKFKIGMVLLFAFAENFIVPSFLAFNDAYFIFTLRASISSPTFNVCHFCSASITYWIIAFSQPIHFIIDVSIW